MLFHCKKPSQQAFCELDVNAMAFKKMLRVRFGVCSSLELVIDSGNRKKLSAIAAEKIEIFVKDYLIALV